MKETSKPPPCCLCQREIPRAIRSRFPMVAPLAKICSTEWYKKNEGIMPPLELRVSCRLLLSGRLSYRKALVLALGIFETQCVAALLGMAGHVILCNLVILTLPFTLPFTVVYTICAVQGIPSPLSKLVVPPIVYFGTCVIPCWLLYRITKAALVCTVSWAIVGVGMWYKDELARLRT
jgi:hypothetical protein